MTYSELLSWQEREMTVQPWATGGDRYHLMVRGIDPGDGDPPDTDEPLGLAA
jgi:hypothetical protein